MATTVINPTPTNTDNSGMGFFLGVVLLIVFIVVLLFYGLPYIQRSFSGAGTQVNIPDHVNVNVQKGK